MRYSVNARAPREALLMADEIYFGHADTGAMIDYIEKYPDKTFIYEMQDISELNIDNLKMYNEKLEGRFYVAVPYYWTEFELLKDNEIKFYFFNQLTTFDQVAFAARLGASYLTLGEPLTHDLKRVSKYNVPIRMYPNVLFTHPLDANRMIKSWVRPEDQELYEEYVSVFDFIGPSSFVKASIKIYKEDKEWKDKLEFLIPDLHTDLDNRAIPHDCIEHRLNCGQRCLSGGYCRLCNQFPGFSQMLTEVARKKKNN